MPVTVAAQAPFVCVPRRRVIAVHWPSTLMLASEGPALSYQFAHASTDAAWRG